MLVKDVLRAKGEKSPTGRELNARVLSGCASLYTPLGVQCWQTL